MKICAVSFDYTPNPQGGVGVAAHELIEKIRKRHEVTVLTIGKERTRSDEKAAAEIGRVLADGGTCVVSFAFSLIEKRPTTCEDGSLQRYYTNDEIYVKIVNPSNLRLEEKFLFCKRFLSFFYSHIPAGWFILKHLVIWLTLHHFENFFLKNDANASAVIFKLKKVTGSGQRG